MKSLWKIKCTVLTNLTGKNKAEAIDRIGQWFSTLSTLRYVWTLNSRIL